MIRILAALALAATLSACGGAEEVGAPPEDVTRATYVHGGQPSLTLLTVISNGSNSGAHTGLMVNGSQRVMWDPAGTFNTSRAMVERGDVLYGMTPAYYAAYVDFHTRTTFRTVEQTIPVSPEVAETALRLVRSQGAVPKAQCALATSRILARLPGFEGVDTGWFPTDLMEEVRALPGVVERVYYDDDDDDNSTLVARPLTRADG
ncbi:hypothetical protein BCF33_2496 [Hasllibacter halocynthiae]|uniref:Lipoprotein n=1 Tax=Hasllibacter halocynthiae TaxID=595589 RepID=A0A2T0X3T4_9RHOB|nr:hypothetical protein [Hasllibacter halocynthiae]PRY93616.1 hypothetical protein BCF33_2496 [Hasllibacter halocynthiae]